MHLSKEAPMLQNPPGRRFKDLVSPFWAFWEATGKHKRCNILYDPSHFCAAAIRLFNLYRPLPTLFIKMFHVKMPSSRYRQERVYGGFQLGRQGPGVSALIGRWAAEILKQFLKACSIWLQWLGQVRVGGCITLPERRCRRCAIHRYESYHPG